MSQNLNSEKRKRVALLFGGRSAEHEISIITALQAFTALDTTKYDLIPVYINQQGRWYTGDKLLTKNFYRNFDEKQVCEITLLPTPTITGLIPIENNQLTENAPIPIDVYLLSFHGQYGEDGCIQGLLELADVAYTGCGVAASAIAMNKAVTKQIVASVGIPVLPSIMIKRKEAQKNIVEVQNKILSTPGLKQFPLFVKPTHLGSSIGIGKATDLPTLAGALAKAFKYDDEALIEPCVTEILEINVSVICGDPPIASVVETPVATGEALTYEDKYLRGGKKTGERAEGMASLTRVIDPVDLDPKIKKLAQDYALKAYKQLDCAGISRFDFIMDLKTGELFFNELNPVPGSLAFYLWSKRQPPLLYTEILDRLIHEALEKKADRLSLQRNLGFKALN